MVGVDADCRSLRSSVRSQKPDVDHELLLRVLVLFWGADVVRVLDSETLDVGDRREAS